jgi:hypothetical protein
MIRIDAAWIAVEPLDSKRFVMAAWLGAARYPSMCPLR